MGKNIVLFGAPGIGKSTVAKVLEKKFSLPHISSGDLLRDAVKNESELGLQAKEYMDAGQLVPDELVTKIVRERLSRDDVKNGYLLDGYPRTVHQGEELKKFSHVSAVLNFVADKKIVVERLASRRICSKCSTVFHLKHSPPSNEGKCDKCGSDLVQRSDDTPDVIMNRLRVYEEQTKPLIDYYRNDELLTDIDAHYNLNEHEKIISQCEEAINSITD